ncbi:MAG: hypothetical protein MAG715_01001 [Methanonatronarchaeales archaeon]|nr:hypothetical protein [Methanonatronarchaeales archaeon]
MLVTAMDPLGNLIELGEERWGHIVTGHPEMESRLKEVETALRDPDLVRRSRYDDEVNLYYRRIGEDYVCVVANPLKGFVLTSYVTEAIKEGAEIWRKG